MFLSFEGIDGSGKTTQATLLAEKLTADGHSVLFLREPGGTEISEQIRQILLNKKNLKMTQLSELLLFSASRSQLVTEVIKPALAKGTIVITDRFADSTTAYQGYGRGLHLGGVKNINSIATAGLSPKRTFFIDIPVSTMYERRRSSGQEIDRMEMSTEEFYHRVREGYLDMSKEEPGRIVTIDGRQPIDIIQGIIWKEVDGMMHGEEQ